MSPSGSFSKPKLENQKFQSNYPQSSSNPHALYKYLSTGSYTASITSDLRMIDASNKELLAQKVVQRLQERFKKEQIYTRIGNDVLISVNPFQWLDIHNPSYMKKYMNADDSANKECGSSMEPHIFETATIAWRRLNRTRKPQCFVISGESGSGKTTTTQLIITQIEQLNHNVSASSSSKMVSANGGLGDYNNNYPSSSERLSSAAYLLDTFGNASTVINKNSSRFGKYIKLNYSDQGKIKGASIERYLLEKSRLVTRDPGEKNFHIFYYLSDGISKCPEKYQYLSESSFPLSSNCQSNKENGRRNSPNSKNLDYMELPSTDRRKHLNLQKENSEFFSHKEIESRKNEYHNSLNSVGIYQTKSNPGHSNIEKYLKLILLLGNIEFQTSSGSSLSGSEKVQISHESAVILREISSILQISIEQLTSYLTVNKWGGKSNDLSSSNTSLQTNASNSTFNTIEVPYTYHEAINKRDAFAKTLYSCLFDYILKECNASLSSHTLSQLSLDHDTLNLSIGVLDIFGLENQKKNSFEQFCINFANEKLQHYCSENVYNEERTLYKQEGLEEFVELSNFESSKDVVDLYSGRGPHQTTGLFYLLNDQAGVSLASRQISSIESNNDTSGDSLIEVFQHNHKNHPKFKVPRKKEEEPVFIITHYAGDIKYSARKFIQKNHDKPSKEIKILIRQCKWNFIRREVFGVNKLAQFYWKTLRSFFRAYSMFGKQLKNNRDRKPKLPSIQSSPMTSILDENYSWSDSKLNIKYWNEGLPLSEKPSDQVIKNAKMINYKIRYQASNRRQFLKQLSEKVYSSETSPHNTRGHNRKLSDINKSVNSKFEVTGTNNVNKTISQEYMSSIDELINELNKSSPYFIRCLRV